MSEEKKPSDKPETNEEAKEPAVLLPMDKPAIKALEATVKGAKDNPKKDGPQPSDNPEPPKPKKSDELMAGAGQQQQESIKLKLQHYDLTAQAERLDLDAEVLEEKAAALRAQSRSLRAEAQIIVRNIDIRDTALNTAVETIKELSKADAEPAK